MMQVTNLSRPDIALTSTTSTAMATYQGKDQFDIFLIFLSSLQIMHLLKLISHIVQGGDAYNAQGKIYLNI